VLLKAVNWSELRVLHSASPAFRVLAKAGQLALLVLNAGSGIGFSIKAVPVPCKVNAIPRWSEPKLGSSCQLISRSERASDARVRSNTLGRA
jgi:hypothetical protein